MKHAKQIKRVFLVTFFLNIFIASLETFYGIWTNTLSMVANGMHSYIDALSSILGFVAITVAAQPSDENHHYGHQKYETLSALGISLFIFITAWEIGKHAIERLLSPEVSDFHPIGIAIIFLSMTVNFLVSRYESKKAKEYHSAALEADAVHTLTDVWVSVVVLVSLICISLGIYWLDVVFSLGIAIYFLIVAIGIVKKNLLVLTDAAFIDITKIKQIVESEKGVIGTHHIRTRGAQGHAFVDLHIQLPPETDLLTSHRIAHRIEDQIKLQIEGIQEVMIHTEPFPDDDEEFVTDEIKVKGH